MATARRARTGAVLVLAGAVLAGLTVGGPAASAAVATGPVVNRAVGCLEPSGTAATARLRLGACRPDPAQQWTLPGDGTLRVRDRCADLLPGRTTRDTPVVLTSCGPAPAGRWSATADGRLVHVTTGLCLQPVAGRARTGAPVTAGTCSAVPAQRWALPATAPVLPPRTTTPVPPPRTTTPVPPSRTTTPPAAVVPVTPPPVVAPAPLWSSDFTTAGTSRLRSTPWNVVGAPAPRLVDSPVTPGARALQVTMPGGGTRAEVEPAVRAFVEGDDLWFAYSVVLAPDFPVDVTRWQVVAQWKNAGTGSPPLELTVGRGKVWLSGGYGHPAGPRRSEVAVGPATRGARTDLLVHVRFSRDPALGRVDVWQDGRPAVVGFAPPGGTLYPSGPGASLSSYWKAGLYRDPAITAPAALTVERAAVGASAAAVAPR